MPKICIFFSFKSTEWKSSNWSRGNVTETLRSPITWFFFFLLTSLWRISSQSYSNIHHQVYNCPQQFLLLDSLGDHFASFCRTPDSFNNLIPVSCVLEKTSHLLVAAWVIGQLLAGHTYLQQRGQHWTNMNKAQGSLPGRSQSTDGKMVSGSHFPQGPPSSWRSCAQGITHMCTHITLFMFALAYPVVTFDYELPTPQPPVFAERSWVLRKPGKAPLHWASISLLLFLYFLCSCPQATQLRTEFRLVNVFCRSFYIFRVQLFFHH